VPSIKQKTISGILWSSVDNFTTQGIVFVVGIFLARLLEPKEFGLIGMITIFIAISDVFIRSGFSEALIRKNNCTQTDYSTVFFFNLIAGIVFFSILFTLAPYISIFFKEPILKPIVRVLATVLIIDSLIIIQRTILVKRVDFKLQTRISVISSVGSGALAVILAYKGFGVWSLVALTITRQMLNSVLLWFWNKWRPTLIFSKDSFKELFGFGNKLLLSGLIDTVYNNLYYLVIGKYFSATELGFYTRAHNFSNFPSHNINTVVGRVTYPVLSDMQDYPDLLKTGYRRIIKSTMLITFVLMLGLAAIAEPMIITLIGEKWSPSIIYLQLLCFGGMLYPLHSLNLNMLKVLGRSDLFLKLEIIKKCLAIPVIVIGIFLGIKIMIIGMILNSFIAYYINSYWSGRLIKYGLKDQVRDIAPSFLMAAGMAFTVYILGYFLKTSSAVTLIIQVTVGGAIAFAYWEMLKMPDYLYIKQVVIEKFFTRKQL
jgi:teichuronic acid exporter